MASFAASGINSPGLSGFLSSNEGFVNVLRNLETDFEKESSYEKFVKTPTEITRMYRLQIEKEREILASDEKWKVPESFHTMSEMKSIESSCPPALSNFGK